MTRRTPILTALGFTAILLALAVSDALLTQSTLDLPFPSTSPTLTADVTGIVAPAKSGGTPVEQILKAQSMEFSSTSEQSLLVRIVPEPSIVRTQVLLKNGDRLALVSWMESPSVKTYFNSLKDALHASFSDKVSDLRDETLTAPDKPTVNFLTFRDPTIAPERLVFLRIRERLFELHVADGKDVQIAALLTELSR